MPKVKDITRLLENLAPLAWQESYDNAGLQTGNIDAELTGILVTLDCTPEIVEEAVRKNCNLIVAHHPVIFKPLKRLTGSNQVEQTIIKAIQHNIAIYASHTNLDSVIGGVNSKIADKLGLRNVKILDQKKEALIKLVTFAPKENTDAVLQAMHAAGAGQIGDYKNCSYHTPGEGRFLPTENTDPHIGEPGKPEKIPEDRIEVLVPITLQNRVVDALVAAHPYEEVAYDLYPLKNAYQEVGTGMIGELADAMDLAEFIAHLKTSMEIPGLKHTKIGPEKIKKVAICGGAGSFLIGKALQSGADALVTADLKYHEYFSAENRMHLFDLGHYESEVFTKEIIYDLILQKFPNFAVLLSETNTNPVTYS